MGKLGKKETSEGGREDKQFDRGGMEEWREGTK